MKDKTLIEGCLQQKREYQKILYDTYSGQMYSICLRYHKDKHLANESLQRGFIKVFSRLNTFQNKGSLGAWIRSIIVTTSIDVLKEQQNLRFEDIEKMDNQSFEQPMSDSSFDTIDYPTLLQLLNTLPMGYRTVFSMYVLDNLSHDEIAEILKISVGTSRSQLSKARIKLQAKVLERIEDTNMKKIRI